MTLQAYFDTVSPGKRGEMEEVWEWAAAVLADADLDHVREAVENECRFPDAGWDDLFSALDDAEEARVPAAMTAVFQEWIKHGAEISDLPAPQGRAIDANRFLSWLDDQNIFASPAGKRRFLDDVQGDSHPIPPSHQQLRQLKLGHYVIWATFRQEVVDPFADWTTAEEIRSGLGLMKPATPDQKLFLLVYYIPDEIAARYPTIADAYAAEGDWNPNFECAPPNARWGYTSGDAPEVVHDVIQGAHLINPDSEDTGSIAAVRVIN
jgi:hypothetical protein